KTATVSGGKWTMDIDLEGGSHEIAAAAGDVAGNLGEPSESITVEITEGSTATTAPTEVMLLAKDDTGISSSDGITSKKDVTITGSSDAGVGTVVTLFDGSTSKGTTKVGAAGNWSIVVKGLAAGPHSFTATQVVDGEPSPASEPLDVTVDFTAPAVPGGLNLVDEDDLGLYSTDNITAVTEDLTIKGTGEAGNHIILFADKNKNGKWDTGEFKAVGPATDAGEPGPEGEGEPGGEGPVILPGPIVVGEDGTWEGNFELLAGGTHSIVALQTDLAGNMSKVSPAMSVVVDTSPPLAPAKLDLAATSDTGAVNSDNITGVKENLVITGVGEKGLRVELFAGTDGGELEGPVAVAVVDAKGNWSAKIAETEELAVGDYAIVAKQMDLAGNLSPASAPLNLKVIDILPTEAPPAPTLLAADDTGIAAMPETFKDGITGKNKALTIVGAGAIPNTKITLYEEGVGVSKAVGTAVATKDGAWNVKIASLSNGVHTFVADQIGDGGLSGKSEGLAVSVNATVPAAPAGMQVNELIGNTQTLETGVGVIITGTGEDGAVVTVFNDANKNSKVDAGELLVTAAPIVVDGGIWSVADVNLSGGTNTVRAFQTNLAGTASKVSATALTVIVNTPGNLDLATDDDTGVSKSDNITNKNSGLTLSGTATGTRVKLLVDGEETANATVSKGLWKTDLSLSEGTYVITATQTNKDGSESEPSAPFTLVVDQNGPDSAPTELTITGAARLEDESFITNKTAGLVISGTGEPGAGIILLENKKSIATGIADSEGAWSVTIPKISAGKHTLVAQQTDLAGNASPELSEALLFTVDGTAPAAPASLKFSSSTNFISGKGEAGASLTLFNDVNNNGLVDVGERIGEVLQVESNGGWSSVDITDDLPAGKYPNIKAIQTDLAGNVSKASSALSITVAAASLSRALQSYSSPIDIGAASSSVGFALTSGDGSNMLDNQLALLSG
ncbi:MAG: hypothetical protein HQL60_02640, partial [Magnetococcales bacterium]|nr:hypothetical protein [Magnetococcales bacterium]